jgi:hypothetical protein
VVPFAFTTAVVSLPLLRQTKPGRILTHTHTHTHIHLFHMYRVRTAVFRNGAAGGDAGLLADFAGKTRLQQW